MTESHFSQVATEASQETGPELFRALLAADGPEIDRQMAFLSDVHLLEIHEAAQNLQDLCKSASKIRTWQEG
jgi:hypothetical protein